MLTSSSRPSDDVSLDVFDHPVEQFVRSRVRELGYSPEQLGPIIEISVEQAKKLVGGSADLSSPRILRQKLESHAFIYVQSVLSQGRKWTKCRERIRSYSAVFMAGAGVSFGSDMPLSGYLDDLLRFCDAKDWTELRGDDQKCLKFKTQFKTICTRKQPSAGHKLIILNFPDHILEIICLNWDDLFERAAGSMGKAVDKNNEDDGYVGIRHLWKFHGDVANIKQDNIPGKGGWIFPDADGYVFGSFNRYIQQVGLRDELFILVIIGYSENEKVIYDRIISLLERIPPRPTYRIGLDLSKLNEEQYIVGTADFILDKILPKTNS